MRNTTTATIRGLLGILAVLLMLPTAAVRAQNGELKLNDLYKKLAERNNYPVVQGLRQATAEVSCGLLDQVIGAFPEAAGASVKVTYTWSRPSEDVAPTKKFTISGIPEGLTDLSSRANIIFQQAQDFVIEDPIYWTIAQTQASASQNAGTITVTGSGQQISSLIVKIDEQTYQVHMMELTVGGSDITFEMTSEDLGGRWGTKSLILTHPQATRVVQYEYAQVQGFWLPSKITLEFKGTEEPPFVYEFSNWQVEAQPKVAESAS